MTRGKVTISDVARRAKVSVGTVSHVLTGSINVTAERRERVTRAIDALGYIPNVHAQGLRRGHSMVIGICFPFVNTAYLNALSEAIERNAARDGYGVVHVFSRHDPEAELKRLRELIRYRVDGLVLFPSSAPERALDLVEAKGLPVVTIERTSDDARFDQVTVDNRRGMYDAAARLIALGHRRLLVACRSRKLAVNRLRALGLKAAQREAPAPVDVVTLEVGDDEPRFRAALRDAMRGAAPPTAIITSNSHHASLVYAVLREIGADVPGRVSVLTFDDPEWSRIVEPELSVIRQPAEAMAEEAWRLLARRIAKRAAQPTEAVALGQEIVFRASVAAPHADVAKAPPRARRRASRSPE